MVQGRMLVLGWNLSNKCERKQNKRSQIPVRGTHILMDNEVIWHLIFENGTPQTAKSSDWLPGIGSTNQIENDG